MVSQKMLPVDDNQINLNAIKNQDPFAKRIIDKALRVAIYKFLSKFNEWQKLEYEGSMLVFERMFEPLNSLAVMNTLKLELFLQPLTCDIEFQDRNPFLLYKSNNDGNDCERIKNLILELTNQAKERRTVKCDKKISLIDKLNETSSTINNQYDLQQVQLTPTTTATSIILPTSVATVSTNTTLSNNSTKDVDILKMLAKAQNNYLQSKSSLNENSSNNINEQPLSIGNWPNDYHLNSTTYVKPEPIRLLSNDNVNITSPTSSTSSKSQENCHLKPQQQQQQQQQIDPIIQRLLSTPLTATNIIKNTPNQNETSFSQQNSENSTHDLISLDLKRKLNIKPTVNETSSTTSSSSSTIKVPFTANAFNSINNTKTLMTVKDFEANLLANEVNNATIGLTFNDNNESQLTNKSNQQQPIFYLDQSNQSYGMIRPNKLSLFDLNDNNDQHISSNSESSHEGAISPVLPLLLTPAAFESTTQNVFFTNNNVNNPLVMPTTTFANENNNTIKLTNPTTIAAAAGSHQQQQQQNSELFDLNQNNENNKNRLLLTKSQLQQTLIHLLKNDEQFLNTIHEAYTSNYSNKKI